MHVYRTSRYTRCKSTELHSAEQKLQKCLKKLEVWCNENGFKFSPTKTICVHFTKKRNAALQTQPLFKWTKNTCSSGIKILGVIFDKLTFIPHIEYLKTKCKKNTKLTKSRGQFGVGRRSRGPPETISVPCQIQVGLWLHSIRCCTQILPCKIRSNSKSRTQVVTWSILNVS